MDAMPNVNDFRVVNGKYMHNNEEVSAEEFARRQSLADKALQDFKSEPTPGFEDMEDFAAQARARAAARRRSGKKSGGGIKLEKSKISTHQKSKKSPSW